MKVVVIGAGMTGLALAAALARDPSIEVELFERDAGWSARGQGYSIGLKGDGGLLVARRLGLLDALTPGSVAITDFVFCDQRGRRLMRLPGDEDPAGKHATLRVRRDRLREVLRDAAPATPLRFGREAIGFTTTPTSASVRFADGSEVAADWVIAADGAGSAIRTSWLGDRRHDLGLFSVTGDAPGLDHDHPLLSGGYFMTLGDDGSSLFAYRETGGVHVSRTVPGHAPAAPEVREVPAVSVLRAVSTWHDPIPAIIDGLDENTVRVRGYHDVDPIRSVRAGRVWLIGDAAHPMSPFQGQGANTGLLDAGDLAAWLASGADDAAAGRLDRAIAARGRRAVLASRQAAEQFHTTSRFRQRSRNLGFRMADRVIAWSVPRPLDRRGSMVEP